MKGFSVLQYIEHLNKSLNYEIPKEIIRNAFYAKLAQIVSFKRVKFEISKNDGGIANVYSMTFAPSGFGKDKILRKIIKMFFKLTDQFIDKYFEDKIHERKIKIEKEATNIFGTHYSKENAKEKWLSANKPRDIQTILTESTQEAYLSDRYEMSNYPLGSICFKNDEFLDFLLSNDKKKSDLMTLFAQVYDHGDDYAKSLKSESTIKKASLSIPNNLLVYASADSIHEDDTFKILMKKLQTQYARRSFIIFFNELQETDESFENFYEKSLVNESEINDFNKNMIDQFIKIPDSMTYKLKPNSIEHRFYYEYLFNTKKDSKKLTNKILSAEMAGRSWKMIKLATIIHAIKDPLNEFISMDALNEAVDWSNICADHLTKLVMNRPAQSYDILWNFFKENLSKKIMGNTLRELNIFNSAYHAKYLHDFIEHYVHDKAHSEGLVFEVSKGSGNTKYYCLKKINVSLKGE